MTSSSASPNPSPSNLNPTESGEEFTEANPKPLRLEFAKEGLRYKQLKRSKSTALYRVLGAGLELIRIKVSPPGLLPNGKPVFWRETYPGAEAFGRMGWYFMPQQEAEAYARFDALVAAEGERC